MAARSLLFTILVIALAGSQGAALAQTAGPAVTPTGPAAGTSPNVSVTGQHVPAVGLSKSSGVTPLDKKQERKMKKETTICKGC